MTAVVILADAEMDSCLACAVALAHAGVVAAAETGMIADAAPLQLLLAADATVVHLLTTAAILADAADAWDC